MKIRWVQLADNNPTQVPTKGGQLVDDFLEACKKKLSPLLNSYASAQLSLFVDGVALKTTDLVPEQESTDPPFIITVTGTRIKWEETDLAALVYDSNSALFQLDVDYLAKTGLASQKLILYCRDAFKAQFNFLRERVVESGVLGWILGPPGTGKSTTALAFASTLPRNDWVVTWIHLSRVRYPTCVRLEGDKKKSIQFHGNDVKVLETLEGILNEVHGSKNHIVFVDGYTLHGDKHSDIQKACYYWLENSRISDKGKKRLVVVCSMSASLARKSEGGTEVEEFFVHSWSETEYFDAVDNPEFFENVKNALDSNPHIDDALQEKLVKLDHRTDQEIAHDLVRSKFYLAGLSARWMFHFPTATVTQETYDSVDAVTDIIPYLKGTIGDLSNNVVNRLFSSSSNENPYRRKSIVSQFAGVQLAIRAGPDLIRHLDEATSPDGNPAMHGWMLEIFFFSSLRHGGVKVLNKEGKVAKTWPASLVKPLDTASLPHFNQKAGEWFKPNRWNQGGYDAVYIDKSNGLVKFVQVTASVTHSFKTEYFHGFLTALEQSFKVKVLKFVFLVEQSSLADFKLGVPSVKGLFTSFGWKSGQESDHVEIFGIRGWKKEMKLVKKLPSRQAIGLSSRRAPKFKKGPNKRVATNDTSCTPKTRSKTRKTVIFAQSRDLVE